MCGQRFNRPDQADPGIVDDNVQPAELSVNSATGTLATSSKAFDEGTFSFGVRIMAASVRPKCRLHCGVTSAERLQGAAG